ncbi:MAG: class I SAM-dependent methyltransferase [Lachnospiraceae bacterium]
MEAYTSFAYVYDTFMDNVPYEEWGTYIKDILCEYGITEGLVLDLGCGTGSFTEVLADKGYDMIGVDNAEEMLQIAIEKREHTGHDILYLLQDMREFELYGTVRAIVSICDSLNYICEESELLQVFRLVNNYLDPHGLFVFDMNTLYKYEQLLGDCTIAENREDCSFIWDNYYDKTEQMNEYELTIFVREGALNSNQYRKYEELHYQRAYEISRVQELLKEAGMQLLAVYDAGTKQAPRADSERVHYIARECGKHE